MDGMRVRFYPRSDSPDQIVSDHQSARPTTSLDELDETGDQSSECSSTLTPDSNSKSRSFNFVRKFRERRITTNSDSVIVTKSSTKRSISPIEKAVEVVDDRTIMDLNIAPEQAIIHETAGRFTITHNGTLMNPELAQNGEKSLGSASPNRNSTNSFSSSHDLQPQSESSCSASIHSTASAKDEKQMQDEETSTPDAPTATASPSQLQPPIVPTEKSEQETEVGSLGEQILHAVPLAQLGEDTHLSSVVKFGRDLIERYRRIPLKKYRFCAFVVLAAITYVSPGFITGVLWGLYAATILFLYVCVSDPIQPEELNPDEYSQLLERVKEECIKEEHPAQAKIYRGWMNLFDDSYNPHTFHVNDVQTVLVRLDGKMLRISRPDRVMLKHGFHTDPTLVENEPRMIAQNIYDLTNATVKLRPRRLAKRRWFSRKYPICIRLSADSNEILSSNNREYITITDVPEMRGTEEVEEEDNDESESEKNSPNLGRRATAVEVGREADGYLSDSEDESDDDQLFVPRSASDVHLNQSSGSGGILSRFRKNNAARQSFRSSRTIYLFARCAREKERWFHRLRRACYKFSIPKDLYASMPNRRFSLPSGHVLHQELSRDYFLYILHALQFNKHLNEILESESLTSAEQNGVVFMDLGRNKWNEPTETSGKELVRVANLLVSRVFYDFCRDKYWCAAVQNKIQNKLATLHLPYFVETLELSSFNIGTAIPSIEKIYEPVIDEWGIWVDFEIKYDGLIKLALETRVNLLRIKEQHDSTDCSSNSVPSSIINFRPLSRYSDEEIPESPETSPDEDYGSKMKYDSGKEKKKSGKKVLHLIDKIAHSNFFKEASELKPIRKLMEEVSSTRLMLNVEVTKLEGTMTVNLAPPPSDRLWYSFRKAPKMSIHAAPQIGDRTVVFSTLSDWIEKKMVQLLEKNLVVPNMDDIIIPVCSGNDLLQGPINK